MLKCCIKRLNNDSKLRNVTVFENTIETDNLDRAGGVRIEGGRNFEIENSLIYNNKIDVLNSSTKISDLGHANGAEVSANVSLILKHSLLKVVSPQINKISTPRCQTTNITQ